MKLDKVLNYIIYMYFLIPLMGFLSYKMGIYINFDLFYNILFVALIIIFFSINKGKEESIFFIILAIPIFYNIILSILNDGAMIGILNSLKILKNYYLVILVGFIVYKVYYIVDNISEFYSILAKIGLLIATFNFILSIDTYTHSLNFASSVCDYVDTYHSNYSLFIRSSVGLNRPAGYFYDLHSQTYLPMGALFLLLLKMTKIRFQSLVIFLLIFSILLSSVRMSYAMLVIFSIYLLTIKKQKFLFWISLFLFLIGISWYFHEYIIMFFDQIIGVRGNSANTTGSHLITIPFLLWDNSTITFFFGGNSNLRSEIYSEVYIWTLLFYIGLVGWLFYILPLFLVINYKKYKVGIFFTLYMLVSLLHYKVYNTGVNIFISSIGFVYMFIIINNLSFRGKEDE